MKTALYAGVIVLELLLCFCVPGVESVGAHRIRAVLEMPDGKERVSHGTAFVIAGKVFTALHVVLDHGDVFIEAPEGWIRCKVLTTDEKCDVAILAPVLKIADTAGAGDCCCASIKGAAVKALKSTEIERHTARVPGYDHGGSGAPVYKNGVLVGMAVSFKDEAHTDEVNMAPGAILREMLNDRLVTEGKP